MTTAAQNTARQNAANAMRQAWAIAKAAAAETGKKAALFFREALRQAWAAIKNAKEVITTMPVIKDADYVNNMLRGAFIDAYASDWTGRTGIFRTYININGDRGCRGDRTAKIYFENNELVVDMGKGVHSQKFKESLEKIKELFA